MLDLPYIEAPAGERSIELISLDVDVRVTGLYAETTQTLEFRNPNQRELEGSLIFPLPEAATVCGYALDINGFMVDSVLVPKQQARRILDAEVRKGVDPGLIEHVQGNTFRTRIYPFPPGGMRRVRVTYISELSVDSDTATYHLPLNHAASLPEIPVLADVLSPVDPHGASLEKQQGRWVGKTVLRNSESFQLTLPNLPNTFSVVEEAEDGEAFFSVSMRLPPSSSAPLTPHRVGVVWDASGSRGDLRAELQMLRELAARWPQTSAHLQVVRDRLEEPREFPNLAALAAYVEQQPCDGATNLSALTFSDPVDAWLVFSDGLDTLLNETPRPGSQPIYTIASGSRAHHAWLGHLAEASGGASLNLSRSSVEKAVAILSLGTSSYQPHWEGGESVHLVRSNDRLQLLGRLGERPLRMVLPSGEALEVTRAAARPGRLLARAWAGRESAKLALSADSESRVLELGRRYHLVTPGTSLLVLENLDQYLEYDLEPPASQSALREEWWRLRRHRDEEEGGFQEARLDRVARLWAERVAWWQRDYRAEWPDPKSAKADESAREPHGALPPPVPAPMAASAPLRRTTSVSDQMEEAASPCASMDDDLFGVEPEPEGANYDLFASDTGSLSLDMLPGEESGLEARGKSESGDLATVASISIQAWNPDTPYLSEMRASDDPYARYLELRPDFANSPSFYLDCADYLLQKGHTDLGLRVLSNLSELALEDPALMRMHAWRLQNAQRLDLAIPILEQVLRLRPDEPQSHRDLGLAHGQRFEETGDRAEAERAVDLLFAVVSQTWDRFPEIELIALMELNRLLEIASRRGHDLDDRIDSRLRKTLDLDVRISLSWDADLTDVDLHVHEPTGEHAYYGHRNTVIGGLVSYDVRQGYGPEEYVLRRAFPGDYQILGRFYGSHQQTLTGACTVTATVFTNYARLDEQRQTMMLRLDQPSDEVAVGQVRLG